MSELRATEPDGPLPGHGPCYICGDDNPAGLGLQWYADGNLVYSEFRLSLGQQGPPGHVHGGASAAILDEAMGKAVWRAGLEVLLANLNLNYRLPAPLGVALRCEARVERSEGRKAWAKGRILLPDGGVAVEGVGLYVRVPHFFAGHDWRSGTG